VTTHKWHIVPANPLSGGNSRKFGHKIGTRCELHRRNVILIDAVFLNENTQ